MNRQKLRPILTSIDGTFCFTFAVFPPEIHINKFYISYKKQNQRIKENNNIYLIMHSTTFQGLVHIIRNDGPTIS